MAQADRQRWDARLVDGLEIVHLEKGWVEREGDEPRHLARLLARKAR